MNKTLRLINKFNWLVLTMVFICFQAGAVMNNEFHTVDGMLSLPAVQVTDDMLYRAGMAKTGAPGFQFELHQLLSIGPNTPFTAKYDPVSELLTMDEVEMVDPVGGVQRYQVSMQHIPNSDPFRMMVMEAKTPDGVLLYSSGLGSEQGTLRIHTMDEFDHNASLSGLPGVQGVQEIKFLLTDIDSSHPVLYFQNSKNYPLHFDFARKVLGWYAGVPDTQAVAEFNATTYFSDQRRQLAGSVVYYQNFKSSNDVNRTGLFTVEFWPTDPVSSPLIKKAYQFIKEALPVSRGRLAYHPVSDTHEQLYLESMDDFNNAGIRTIFTDELFSQTDSAVLNTGEAYGRLRVINPGDPLPTEKDIVIYSFIPNSLSHVAGIITDAPQTPLSHINVKARQNNTPNAYIKSAITDPAIEPLIGNWVHYLVSREGIRIQPSSREQAEDWLDSVRPAETQTPESDLTVTEPARLTSIGFSDWTAFGVKAANVAELGRILEPGIAPDGYGIPFAVYDEFMKLGRCGDKLIELCASGESGKSFYQQAMMMIAATDFLEHPEIRAQRLKIYRDSIEDAEAPDSMIAKLEQIRYFWEPGGPPFTQSLRTRSSTNNEDLPGFNGAGLYKSYTHKKDEGDLIKSVKQVWASLWTDRAYDERYFHRIDHFKTYMGVLVHPNYGDEQVNGVGITKNIYNPNWPGFYVNAQYGEISITNPEPMETEDGPIHPVPDEFIMTRLPAGDSTLEWETQFIRRSNVEMVYDQPVPTDNVLTDSEMVRLREAMALIRDHFTGLYQAGNEFALELEFKVTETFDGSRGNLAIKQVRPWVD